MIVGSIDNLEHSHEKYPKAVRKALTYLQEHDFTKMEDGLYPIDGKKIFAKVQRYQTRPISECRPEAHRKFLDIQYIAEGEELFGWCPISPDIEQEGIYDEGQDVAFYDHLVPDSAIVLFTGNFVVLYPEDVHRPCGMVDTEPKPVTKVVVKIAVSMLE